jgi:DNA-directed RNA polymerase specialized sigma24 family protein
MKNIILNLPILEGQVIIYLYIKCLSYEDIACKFNLSVLDIKMIEIKALDMIREMFNDKNKLSVIK